MLLVESFFWHSNLNFQTITYNYYHLLYYLELQEFIGNWTKLPSAVLSGTTKSLLATEPTYWTSLTNLFIVSSSESGLQKMDGEEMEPWQK